MKQEIRVLGKALSWAGECTVTQDTKGGKDQVDCMCVYVSAAQQGVEHKYSSKRVGGTRIKALS